jgi:hypothetical protein
VVSRYLVVRVRSSGCWVHHLGVSPACLRPDSSRLTPPRLATLWGPSHECSGFQAPVGTLTSRLYMRTEASTCGPGPCGCEVPHVRAASLSPISRPFRRVQFGQAVPVAVPALRTGGMSPVWARLRGNTSPRGVVQGPCFLPPARLLYTRSCPRGLKSRGFVSLAPCGRVDHWLVASIDHSLRGVSWAPGAAARAAWSGAGILLLGDRCGSCKGLAYPRGPRACLSADRRRRNFSGGNWIPVPGLLRCAVPSPAGAPFLAR